MWESTAIQEITSPYPDIQMICRYVSVVELENVLGLTSPDETIRESKDKPIIGRQRRLRIDRLTSLYLFPCWCHCVDLATHCRGSRPHAVECIVNQCSFSPRSLQDPDIFFGRCFPFQSTGDIRTGEERGIIRRGVVSLDFLVAD